MLKVIAIATLALSLSAPTPASDNSNNQDPQEIKVESVDFKTRVVKDKTLPEGVEVEIQKGLEGKRVFYKESRQTIGTDGAYEEIPVYFDEVVDLPVEKVVRQGTNKLVIEGVSEKTLELEKTKAHLEKVKAAEAKVKAEAEAEKARQDKIDQQIANAGSMKFNSAALSELSSATGVTTAAENRAYAKSVLSESDFRIADKLVNRESGWKTTATNPSSGAYGLPQSLPAGKLASAGSDWRTNGKTQFNWMMKYVADRYGSWSAALDHSNRKNWY